MPGLFIERPHIELDVCHTTRGGFSLQLTKQSPGNSLATKMWLHYDPRQVADSMRRQTPAFFALSKLRAEKRDRLLLFRNEPE